MYIPVEEKKHIDKEKLITCIEKRLDLLNKDIKDLSCRYFELDTWLDKIKNGEFGVMFSNLCNLQK